MVRLEEVVSTKLELMTDRGSDGGRNVDGGEIFWSFCGGAGP